MYTTVIAMGADCPCMCHACMTLVTGCAAALHNARLPVAATMQMDPTGAVGSRLGRGPGPHTTHRPLRQQERCAQHSRSPPPSCCWASRLAFLGISIAAAPTMPFTPPPPTHTPSSPPSHCTALPPPCLQQAPPQQQQQQQQAALPAAAQQQQQQQQEVTFVDKVRAICGVLSIGNAALLGKDKPLALQTAAMSLRNGNAFKDNPFADSVEGYWTQQAAAADS